METGLVPENVDASERTVTSVCTVAESEVVLLLGAAVDTPSETAVWEL